MLSYRGTISIASGPSAPSADEGYASTLGFLDWQTISQDASGADEQKEIPVPEVPVWNRAIEVQMTVEFMRQSKLEVEKRSAEKDIICDMCLHDICPKEAMYTAWGVNSWTTLLEGVDICFDCFHHFFDCKTVGIKTKYLEALAESWEWRKKYCPSCHVFGSKCFQMSNKEKEYLLLRDRDTKKKGWLSKLPILDEQSFNILIAHYIDHVSGVLEVDQSHGTVRLSAMDRSGDFISLHQSSMEMSSVRSQNLEAYRMDESYQRHSACSASVGSPSDRTSPPDVIQHTSESSISESGERSGNEPESYGKVSERRKRDSNRRSPRRTYVPSSQLRSAQSEDFELVFLSEKSQPSVKKVKKTPPNFYAERIPSNINRSLKLLNNESS